jgi:hypothetical protein
MNLSILQTPQFKIRKSASHVVLDIRLREGVSATSIIGRQLAPIHVRLAAEQRLHQLYIKSSNGCKRGNCSDTPPSSLYITLRYLNGKWSIVCDAHERKLGLCGLPLQDHFAKQLQGALREATTLHNGARCLAIHIAFSMGDSDTHANTLLLDPQKKHAWRFEPLGDFVNGFRSSVLPNIYDLQHAIELGLRNILHQIGYRYRGEISPYSPFQDDNPELCYLWTTWVEFLVALNPTIPPNKLAKYLEYRYKQSILLGRSRKHMILLFAHYLHELLKYTT